MKLNTRSPLFQKINILLGSILFPLYACYWCATHFNVESLLLLFIAQTLGGLHISLFVHRAWSHRSWRPTVRWLNLYGLFVHTIGFTGSSLAWVAVHRKHHRLEDTPEDPHSPYYISRWRIVFWPTFKTDYSYIGDLLKDPDHKFFAEYYWHITAAWWTLLFIISPALLSFWIAYIGAYSFKMRLINSIGHADPANKSTNNRPVFAYLYLDGEPWHDNHSKNPRDWEFGKAWYQVDFGKYCIRVFEKLGFARINTGWKQS